MNAIFFDAGALHALNSPRDQHNEAAKILLKEIISKRIQVVVTDYIIDEAATSLLTTIKGGGYAQAVNMLDWIGNPDNQVQIVWIDQIKFFQAIKVFRQFNQDKSWSFTDCTSYVVMKELKITQVFTFDEHFEQMGFEVLG